MLADAIRYEEAAKINSRANAIGMTPADYDPRRLPAPSRTAVEMKHDGIGLCYVAGLIETLEGVPMRCASHLQQGLDALAEAFGQPMYLQGEYQEAGGFEATLSAFQRGVGQGAVFIFDAVPYTVWDGLEHSPSLETRRAHLEAAFDIARPVGGVGLVKQARGFDQEGVELAAGAVWQDGGEGVVVKNLDSPFVRAKDRSWMKIKRVLSVDVPIQAVHSTGGRLDKIIVTYRGKPVAVPVGFSTDQRWRLDEFRIGRMVEIKHNGETKGGFLKGASFARFRDDKGKGN